MKKDIFATLHCYDNNQLLIILHTIISNILNIKEILSFSKNYYE